MKFLKKRNGTVVTFDQQKISNAMEKAFKACGKEVSEKTLAEFTDKVIEHLDCHHKDIVDIEDVQNQVECVLMDAGIYDVAKAYITYRYTRTLARKQNTTDESILKLIRNENKELAEENANKSTAINSTQRDYIAGEVSRDLTRRVLLPEEIRQGGFLGPLRTCAHEEEVRPGEIRFPPGGNGLHLDGIPQPLQIPL